MKPFLFSCIVANCARWRYGLFLMMGLICSSSLAIDLPDMGTSVDMTMSPLDEQKLGEAFMRQLRTEVEVIDNIEINTYLSALGHRLASYSNHPEQPFTFFIINEPSINAFAVPGGFIGVHSGLILKTQDESELASVIAHEISHVTQRHIARTIEATQRFSLPVMAALLAAIVLGATTDNPDIGMAAAAAATAGNIQMQLNFTRAHEQEADRIGMQILTDAGFDSRSMPAFFERLQTASRYSEGGLPEFLRTHPVTTERIAEAYDRAEKHPKFLKDTPLYHLMRAKLLVVIEKNPNQLIQQLQRMLKEGSYRDERATHYALALALFAGNQTAGVQTQLDWLLKHDEERLIYRLLEARLALVTNKLDKGLQIYEQTLKLYPQNQLLSLDYAEVLLQNRAADKAKNVLLALSATNNPHYYHLLAEAYQGSGNIAEAGLAMAENYYLSGKTALAVEQLEQALRQDSLDFYLSARLEARLKALQQELREERAEQKQKQPE
ncbi:MAG: hypothetical protein BWK79_10045 [Beggiatoa sp. IS2]|nr:MAG: hypothetical protein BWK79_10045 [Beggiatoa sp. IS2]